MSHDRFWPKVRFQEDGCWIWTAHTNAGYGAFYDNQRKAPIGAHKWAYEALVGPVAAGLTLDHLCRVRACVNPEHLEPVTIGTNVLRGAGVSAKHARATACPRGHAYDGLNLVIKRDGARACRECSNARRRAKYASVRSVA